MSSIFNKPLDSLTVDDVNLLITEGYPEGTHVEYKQELPSKKNKIDPWLKGDSSISEYARNQLLKEIVAFANGVGGYLIIGIEESEVKPARAEALKPIQRCVELAEKLRLQVRDCVSPKLPLFYAEGVVVSQENNEGLVVAYIPQSRMAPHRLEPTLECYLRRNDRSEKMTMREIQDLTMSRSRSVDVVNERFQERKEKFRDVMRNVFSGEDCHGIRATLIPIASGVWVEKVHNNQYLQPVQKPVGAVSGTSELSLNSMKDFATYQSRPILRGSRHYSERGNHFSVQEIYCDGTIEYAFFSRFFEQNSRLSEQNIRIFPEWILSFSINALLMADKFRMYAGFPDFEYGLEIEVARLNEKWRLGKFNSGGYPYEDDFEMEENPLVLPRISVGTREEFPEIMKIINRDLWDSAGVSSSELTIKLPLEKKDV